MKNDLTSIIILNYNGKSFLKNCIESIINNTQREYEIIIVDNNSPDNSGELFEKEFTNCNFILNQENVGVPEGLNIGIQNANGEFLVFLNNDLTVDVGWLDAFFSAYEKFGDALYQPKSLKMKDSKQIDFGGEILSLSSYHPWNLIRIK